MPTKTAKKTTQSRNDRAAQIGCSVQNLSNWQRLGIDVFDDDQIRKKIAKLRSLPPDLKPDWHPKVSAPILPPGDDPTQIDIEAIIGQLAAVTDKHQAQTVKIQIDGLLNAYKLREAAGKYVAKSTVEESLIRIGATFKASLLRMEADLPPTLEGMKPAAMKEAIRGKVDEVLRTLDEEYQKVYGESD